MGFILKEQGTCLYNFKDKHNNTHNINISKIQCIVDRNDKTIDIVLVSGLTLKCLPYEILQVWLDIMQHRVFSIRDNIFVDLKRLQNISLLLPSADNEFRIELILVSAWKIKFIGSEKEYNELIQQFNSL